MADERLEVDGPVEEWPAGANVDAFKAAVIIGGDVIHGDNSNADHIGRLRGVILAAANEGDTVQVQVYGPLVNANWSWIPERPVYWGADGILTQTKPASGCVQIIGWADTPTQLFVNPREPKEQTERHVHQAEQFTLNSTDITNKYVLLAFDVMTTVDVQLFVDGAPPLRYSADFEIDGSNRKKLTWSGLNLDGLLSSSDQLTVHYFRQPTT